MATNPQMATAPQAAIPQQQTDPLAELRDIHLPGAIDAWPPAPGWWFLAALLAGLFIFALYKLYQHWQKNEYRREAIQALKQLKQAYDIDPTQVSYLQLYNNLLKRVALTQYHRDSVASLTGESWVAFLDQTGDTHEFSMGQGQVLIAGHYAAKSQFDADELHRIGTSWVRTHRVQAGIS